MNWKTIASDGFKHFFLLKTDLSSDMRCFTDETVTVDIAPEGVFWKS